MKREPNTPKGLKRSRARGMREGGQETRRGKEPYVQMTNGPISVALRTEIMKHRDEYRVEEEGESEKVNKRTSVFP